jgi:hypothetical protein
MSISDSDSASTDSFSPIEEKQNLLRPPALRVGDRQFPISLIAGPFTARPTPHPQTPTTPPAYMAAKKKFNFSPERVKRGYEHVERRARFRQMMLAKGAQMAQAQMGIVARRVFLKNLTAGSPARPHPQIQAQHDPLSLAQRGQELACRRAHAARSVMDISGVPLLKKVEKMEM